ncbi:MAG: hypothetical protein J7641_21650 [Cyanobacteria bacterium SID2]|nr:hypothetical protein [Cyanobacteria bacterium SID2]MBP0004602.1 hypothetical protein [Cyanobacteria bacterium SBC]
MQQVLTAKLKLELFSDRNSRLRQVYLSDRDALNYTSQVAFDRDKRLDRYKLQKTVSYEIRTRYRLPSQMACHVPYCVANTDKRIWTKTKQNVAYFQAKKNKKRYQELDKPLKFVSRTCTLNPERDYSLTRQGEIGMTLQRRIEVPYSNDHKHVQMIPSREAKIGAAKIYYTRSTQTHYLWVSLALDILDRQPIDIKRIVDVDVEQRYLAVTTDIHNRTALPKSKLWVDRVPRSQKASQSLQHQSTQSARRRFLALLRRERCFVADRKHGIVEQVAMPATLIGESCRGELHADWGGARNMAMRMRFVRQNWTSTRRLSAVPDVSLNEAKAARFLHFAQLQWTIEPSPASHL